MIPLLRRLFIVVICNSLISCGSEPIRQFNSEDLQDRDCLNAFGGMKGYCTK